MVQGAVYDAVNATASKYYKPYLLNRRFEATASKEAAAATAAYTVLSNIVSTVPASIPFPSKESVLQSLASQYASSLGAIPDLAVQGPGNRRGEGGGGGDDRGEGRRWAVRALAVGAELRTRALAAAHRPGHRAAGPRPDPVGRPREAVPHAELLAVPHARARSALDSAAYAAEFNEVKALGSANSTVRTPTQTYIARWWQSNPVASWNDVARQLIARKNLDVVDSARLLAMQNLSGADASINCWNDKYHWDFWRPWNAIPRAAEDGNPATEPDPTWTPLITAPYPEHPSGHICLDAAHVRVLRMYFGDAPEGGYQITSVSTFMHPGDAPTRTFSSFSQALDGAHRGPHLGRPPLPHRRRAGAGPRSERRRIRGGELLHPAAGHPAAGHAADCRAVNTAPPHPNTAPPHRDPTAGATPHDRPRTDRRRSPPATPSPLAHRPQRWVVRLSSQCEPLSSQSAG